jgi:glucose repression mediator protein
MGVHFRPESSGATTVPHPPKLCFSPKSTLMNLYGSHRRPYNMPENRAPHSHHHPPPSSAYPAHGPPPPYPSASGHPSYLHHSASRHPSGPPPGVLGGPPPPGMPMNGPPPPELAGPTGPLPMSNGNGHGPPSIPTAMSPAARAGKEKQDSILQQLASANENTWVLIGETQ